MEKKALALRKMVKKHCPKKEDLDPRKWVSLETRMGFADFIFNQHTNRDVDNSFDNKQMCEYATSFFKETICTRLTTKTHID